MASTAVESPEMPGVWPRGSRWPPRGMSFWGYSEKLEIFTGTRWDWESEIVCVSKIAGEGPREFVSWEDLPCNCGLAESCVKTKEHKAWHMSRHIAWR